MYVVLLLTMHTYHLPTTDRYGMVAKKSDLINIVYLVAIGNQIKTYNALSISVVLINKVKQPTITFTNFITD